MIAVIQHFLVGDGHWLTSANPKAIAVHGRGGACHSPLPPGQPGLTVAWHNAEPDAFEQHGYQQRVIRVKHVTSAPTQLTLWPCACWAAVTTGTRR